MNELGKLAAKLVEIDESGAGQRLDNFLLKHLKGAPKSLIYRIIRSGEVRINKGRADAADRLNLGDLVRVPPIRLDVDPDAPKKAPAGAARAAGEFPVLYEDEALLALNKPAGVAVHGGSGLKYGVIEALRALRPQAKFLELVHRLDRDTSGVLLLAKKRATLVAMHELLREGKTDKRYLVLIKGRWPHEAKHHVRAALHKFVTAEGERRVTATDAEDGQEAHTIFTLMKRYPEATLLEAQLKTGRTHQIRVHLASSGYPILGDDKYGDFDLNKRLQKSGLTPGLKRMFLHAARISFAHPVSGERMRIEAPLPEELTRYLESL
ncbi:MAG TPA: RluA family pseudouridine synthase [Burkholderiales bacterium]|jgi:23S rRNA pseudouridine955/2504/2580 synthase|nr:RluA family pseudouridine synthase [Burkholderiales bacterium]